MEKEQSDRLLIQLSQFNLKRDNIESIPDPKLRIIPRDLFVSDQWPENGFMNRTDVFNDGSLYFDVKAHNLTLPELGGFIVFPCEKDKLPNAFLPEKYNYEALVEAVNQGKEFERKKQELFSIIRQKQFSQRDENLLLDQTRHAETERQSALERVVLKRAALFCTSLNYYAAPTWKGMPKPNREQLNTIINNYYTFLIEKNGKIFNGASPNLQQPSLLDNICNIISYISDVGVFSDTEKKFKSSMKHMGGTLKHYFASLVLDNMMTIYWMSFSIRITNTPFKRASLVLHGWCQSLFAQSVMFENVPKREFRGLGPFILSYLINIAASIAKVPIRAVYLEAMTGTEIVLKSMKEKIVGLNGPPYITFCNNEPFKSKNDPYYESDVLYSGKQKDKLLVEKELVTFWKRWIKPPPSSVPMNECSTCKMGGLLVGSRCCSDDDE
ncbi:MAG: hypothetical protein K2Q45_06780 [Nitrosomonas sp.]|nr:hypothetical protein [Nitrosomonas sp.]